jgi:hypothetical protein
LGFLGSLTRHLLTTTRRVEALLHLLGRGVGVGHGSLGEQGDLRGALGVAEQRLGVRGGPPNGPLGVSQPSSVIIHAARVGADCRPDTRGGAPAVSPMKATSHEGVTSRRSAAVGGGAIGGGTMTVLSIVSVQPSATTARVLGDIERTDAAWLAGHLRELEGDVTVDARDARVVDPAVLRMFEDFAKFLVRRGNRLVVRGLAGGPGLPRGPALPGRPAQHHADPWPGSRDLRYRVLAGRLRAAAHDQQVARARADVG